MDRNQLIMLGTGNAIVTRCYNTCFIIRTPQTQLLVDAGGGNGILVQLQKEGISLADIHHVFVTHAHTDHILGIIWVVRMVIHCMKNNAYTGVLKVYGHDKVLKVLDEICRMMLPAKDIAYLGKSVFFCEVKNRDLLQIADMQLQCFDILSTKEKQYGFKVRFADGKSLVCLGDEPCEEENYPYVLNADWLLCEAFCLYKDRDVFKPYEKHHSTAMEAGALAERLKVRNLLLYHTEDINLATRKLAYTEEAKQNFSGNVFVPDDLETIDLE